MQDFGPHPVGPLGHPQDDPFFEDPFEAMLHAFGSGGTGNFGPFDPLATVSFRDSRVEEDYFYMDSVGKFLSDAEAAIENTPPIPPTSGPDELERILMSLEDSIENQPPIPSEPEVELFPEHSYPIPSMELNEEISGAAPQLRAFPVSRSDVRPTGRRWGRSKANLSAEKKSWCPIENDFVPPRVCEDKDCEYYNPDIKECMYYSE